MSARILTFEEIDALAALETTPGPWSAEHSGAGRIARPSTGRAVLGVEADGDGVVFVACSRADLELAAAAPDLLATVRHLQRCMLVASQALREGLDGWDPTPADANAAHLHATLQDRARRP